MMVIKTGLSKNEFVHYGLNTYYIAGKKSIQDKKDHKALGLNNFNIELSKYIIILIYLHLLH